MVNIVIKILFVKYHRNEFTCSLHVVAGSAATKQPPDATFCNIFTSSAFNGVKTFCRGGRHRIHTSRRITMKKSLVFLLAFILVLFVVSIMTAAPAQDILIPHDAQWALYLNVEKMTSTQLGQYFMKKDHFALKWKRDFMKRSFEFDPARDIQSLTIFWSGNMGQEPAVCVKGRFDRENLLVMLKEVEGHREIPYGNIVIHHWGGDEFGAFYDKNMIVFSESEKSLKSALDVLTGKKKGSSIFQRIDPKISLQDVFMAAFATNIPELKKFDRSFILEKMKSMNMTAAERGDKIDIRLNLMTVAAEDAKNMQHVIRGLMAMADLKLEETESELRITDIVRINAEGNKLNLQLAYPVEELLDLIRGRKSLGLFRLANSLYH